MPRIRRDRTLVSALAAIVVAAVVVQLGLHAFQGSAPPSTTGKGTDMGSNDPPKGGDPGDGPSVPPGGLGDDDPDCAPMDAFGSEDALRLYTTPPPAPPGGSFFWLDGPSGGGVTLAGGFSGTNNQVEGVDEADVVKTDGEYIYAVSGKSVAVVDAVPAGSMTVLSRITPGGYRTEGLFALGSRLAVLVSWGSGNATSLSVLVYDVSDPANPALARNVSLTGRYVAARMIGDYAYAIAYHVVRDWTGTILYPAVSVDGARRTLGPGDIAYLSDSNGTRTVTLVASVNLLTDEAPQVKAFLSRPSSTVYMSGENLYVASGGFNHAWWSMTWGGENSTVHRLRIDGGRVCYVGAVKVPGTILNQFSMDEDNGYLRVATSGHHLENGTVRETGVYVVNGTLSIVGRLEGIAPGEYFHSARFMGDRAYLVTFKKVDPFFVIDLAAPTAPTVLGYLKIPGFSDYLHPYDEDHIIGVGKDTVDMGLFAWYQGVKLSLFDVTDVGHPTEDASIVIGDRGSSSAVLSDHRAFLFIPDRNLIVLPVDLARIDPREYPDGHPPEAYGDFVWQGAYVLSLTLDGGFAVEGRVSHVGAPEGPSFLGAFRWSLEVYRSLYIGDVLYTVSQETVKANALDGLEEIRSIPL